MDSKGNYHVYRSSAGSGKTFTLAKFYLSLILKNKPQDYFKHILAITFTVKAAAEMKTRIIDYLSGFANSQILTKDHELMISLISNDLSLGKEAIQKRSQLALNAILHDYSSLSIFTIDKFVHKLVRSFATDLGLNPDFEVEIDSKQLIERVVNETLNTVGIREDITRLVLEYSKHQVDSEMYWDVTSNLETLANELNSEDFYLQARGLSHIRPAVVFKIQKTLKTKHDDTARSVSNLGQKAMDLITSLGLSIKDFAFSSKGVYSFFQAAIDENLNKIVSPNSYIQKALEEDKWQSATKSEVVLDIKDALHEILSQLIGLESEIRNAIFYKKLIPQLYSIGLISEFEHLFTEIKFNENQQLLSDFYKLLSDRFDQDQTPFIYERLGNKYKHILIDEFQDTSKLQWINLLPILENSLADGNSSLIVGDAKQSIYRFRGSEPGQFVNQPNNNRPTDRLLSGEYNPHVLDSNYRSSKSIVEFNNRFFTDLSTNYLETDYKEFYTDLIQQNKRASKGYASVTAVEKVDDLSIQELLFDPILQKIKSFLNSEKANPGDICLLFQKNSDAAYFAGRLLQFGFPVTSDESLLLKNNRCVQLIISTIQAQENPYDPFAQQVWLSRLYMSGKINEYHKLAQWLKTERANFNILSTKLALKWPNAIFNQDSFGIIWSLVKIFQLSTEDIFIKSLLDFSLLYDENAAYLRTSFLEHWASKSEKLSIENSDADSIQVMTIHKSKGLEFPHVIVYLPEFQLRKTTKKFAWIDDFSIENLPKTMVTLDSLSKTNYEGQLDEEKSKSSVDLLNSIYVALTRPRETLDILTLGKKGEVASKPIKFIQDWDEWNKDTMSLRIDS